MTAKQFEEMFPSLAHAEAFTVGGKRFVSLDKVLDIIDKDKEEHAKYDRLLNPMWLSGCFDTLDYLREAVLALKGGEQE